MADDLIEIRIPLIVTEDGKYAASVASDSPDPDWDFIEECACDMEAGVAMTRYWVTAYVKRPSVIEVAASISDAK